MHFHTLPVQELCTDFMPVMGSQCTLTLHNLHHQKYNYYEIIWIAACCTRFSNVLEEVLQQKAGHVVKKKKKSFCAKC